MGDFEDKTEARIAIEGRALARLRRHIHATQEDAATRCGVSRVTWARWEAGKQMPTGEMAARLGRFVRELRELYGAVL